MAKKLNSGFLPNFQYTNPKNSILVVGSSKYGVERSKSEFILINKKCLQDFK